MRAAAAALLMLSLLSTPLDAQQECVPDESIGKCFTDTMKAARAEEQEDASEEVGEAIEDRLARQATGLGSSATGLESAVEDFLPLLRLALVASGVEANAQAGDFEYKLPVGGVRLPLDLKLRAAFNELQVFEPLKLAIQEEEREELVAGFTEQLTDGDDVTLGLHANSVTEQLGRRFRRELFQKLFSTLFEKHTATAEAEARDKLNEMIDKLGEAAASAVKEGKPAIVSVPPESISTNLHFDQILDADWRRKLLEQVPLAALEAEASRAALVARAQEAGLFKLADLGHNQPQFHGSLSYRDRREAAGPDETIGMLTYEWSGTNLNSLRKACGGDIKAITLRCYSDYVNEAEIAEGLEDDDRFTLSAEYRDRKRFLFALPEPTEPFDLPSGESLILKLTYGRSVGAGPFGAGNARIDINGTYENIDDDPSRQDRGVATLTYSDRMLKALGVSVSISYANHAKFLPETEDELSAHFGISLRAHGGEEED